jgi:molybdopterin converting factor subunit 1
MKVSVKLFAAARQLTGAGEIALELPAETTVAELRGALAAKHPALAPLLRHALFAIDAEYATDATAIRDGAEIACIPPVSGG